LLVAEWRIIGKMFAEKWCGEMPGYDIRFPASEKENREKTEGARDIVASKMTPAQIAAAQRLARDWKPKKGK